MLEGFRQGTRGTGLTARVLLTAMRSAARSREIAELAVRYRDEGVAGFDIAGREAGHPPTRHLDAFQLMQRENGHFTIHAGEGFGLPSIWEAIQWCNADRLGHGVRIVDDIKVSVDGEVTLGKLAGYVRDTRRSAGDVPDVQRQHRHLRVDRRASDRPAGRARISGHRQHRQPADEQRHPVARSCTRWREAFDYGWEQIRWFTVNAMKSAFLPFDERLALINDVIKPGFAKLMARRIVSGR